MEFLIAGLIIFFAVHLVSIFEIKQTIINRFGKVPYMAVFSIISIIGLGLIIYGKSQSEFISIWQPVAWAHWVPVVIMWPTLILFVWAEIPCSMKITLRHPMLIGITTSAISHLIANGDLATILIMGSFGIYAVFIMLRSGFAVKENTIPASTPALNLIGVVVGTLAYALIFTYHETITGMPIPVNF